MGTPTHAANGDHKHLSDLTQIRGIGAVKKRWLGSLGIHTIPDLAQASAATVQAQAKHDGLSLSSDELEDWIAQARRQHPASEDSTELSSEATAPTGDPTDNGDTPAIAEWESVASFEVTYQTRQADGKTEQRLVARHLETDAVESWPDVETDLLQQWMRDRVEVDPTRPLADTSIEAEITQLRVMQPDHMHLPMVADKTTPLFADAIHTTEPFSLEVSMQFAGLTEAYPERRIGYRVECLARNLATGVTDSLGDVAAHVALSNDAVYKVLLPSLQLPQAGTYRLKVFVTLQHAPEAFDQFKVPLLQVV